MTIAEAITYIENEVTTVAMKTPVLINGVEMKAIVDTGAATCAISKRTLYEIGGEIERSSNVRCIMANGSRTASLGRTVIEIETEEIIVEIEVEVINSQERMLIIGNDFMNEWKAIIDFNNKLLILDNQGEKIYIPIEYTKKGKVKFEIPTPEEVEYEEDSEDEEVEERKMTIEDLEEEYISEDENEVKY